MVDLRDGRLIELDAAIAISKLKLNFAKNLQSEATRIAYDSDDSVTINLDHLNKAIPVAVQATLLATTDSLDEEHNSDGKTRKAA